MQSQKTEPSSAIISVHLDMKGVNFRPGYIPQLMKDLASQGINCVMPEYEDVFPFKGLDLAYDPATVWSKKTLATFRKEAAKNGLEIIPYQQCLGHLEYLFRWNRYKDFAEDKNYPSTLCLTNEKGKALIKDMLRQVIEAHPESRYVNLGMDEAHALVQAAKNSGRTVLDLFVAHLHELLEIVEGYGKTPIICSDMLEDHFEPGILEGLKDRVVLFPWDYSARGKRMKYARHQGFRISREWLDDPLNPEAPAISKATKYLENLEKESRKLIEPYLHGREVDSIYQLHMWSKLGFRTIGCTAIRVSMHGAAFPNYAHMDGNIRCWADAIRHEGQTGLTGASCARGTTFCPPNFLLDLAWPNIAVIAEAMGKHPQPFFPGIPQKKLKILLWRLGRCKADWSIESSIADELEALSPKILAHNYEWRSLILMARTWSLKRRAEFAVEEVDWFRAAGRPNTLEWQRRLNDQARISKELQTLRAKVKAHFGKRYFGLHFEEWLAHLFDIPLENLQLARTRSLKFRIKAKKRYGW